MVFIHHWRILCSSNRKLAWVGFEPTTTEFRSDALSDWVIRPWVQVALKANFVQPLQFHLLFSVTFHFGYCLRQRHVCFHRIFCWGNHIIIASKTYFKNYHKMPIFWKKKLSRKVVSLRVNWRSSQP